VIRDSLIKRIEEEMMEASRVGEKLVGWKSSLEELKEGLLQGLLTWLPLEVSSSTSWGFISCIPLPFYLNF
jgi:hypothetical protein